MMKNKELINQLNDYLDDLKHTQGFRKEVCEKEVAYIRACLNKAQLEHSLNNEEVLQDIVFTLIHVLKNINQEIFALEKECGGVVNYSLYIYERCKDLEAKLTIKQTLQEMLNYVFHYYPELRVQVD